MEHTLTKYKTILYATAAGALAIAALSVLWYASTYAHSFGAESGYNTLSVTAEGKATGIPDIAEVNFSVSTDGGKDVAAAQQDTNTKMDDITKYLMDQGVSKDDITTTGYNVTPRYSFPVCTGAICRTAEVTGYNVTQTVTVKIRDTGKAGTILAGVVGKGSNGVSGPTFVIDDTTKVENDARAKAIEKAKAKAQSIASESGIHLGKLISVSDDNGGYPEPFEGKGNDSVTAPGVATVAPNIQSGSQEVTVNVTLNYAIR